MNPKITKKYYKHNRLIILRKKSLSKKEAENILDEAKSLAIVEVR